MSKDETDNNKIVLKCASVNTGIGFLSKGSSG